MTRPVLAFAAVALALVVVFVAVWLRDAKRNKAEAADEERLDATNDGA
jgi:hypothetical protein